MTILDAYVRVSRVAGREGSSYHSPDIQEQAIARWIAQNRDIELGVTIKEEDVSGGTRIEQRRLNELLLRIEAGVSNGIIVYETDRFGRDLLETLIAQRRIHAADARLVGAEDGVDTSTPWGKSRLVQRAMMAEEYLDDVKRRWRRSTDLAVERGKYVARAPFGYVRADLVEPRYDDRNRLIKDSRLVPDPETAHLVLRGFQMRASGASHLQIARDIGRKKGTVAVMLKNRVYLGEVRAQGGAINRRAHDPIVSEDLFSAVQSRVGTRAPRSDRQREYEPLLNGLIRCADCGYLLQVVNSTRAGGRLVPHYACNSRSNNRPCGGCAGTAERVDDFVIGQVDVENERLMELFAGAERVFALARERVRVAELELEQFVDVAVGLDRELFQRGITSRQREVDQARRDLYELDDPGLGDEDLLVITNLGPNPVVYDPLGRNPERDRRRLKRIIASVTLAAADERRRHQPIEERVSVRWVGE